MSAPVAIADIVQVVAEHYRVTPIDIRSHRRTARVVAPRQIAMYLAARLTERSLPEIGCAIGDRDHTTVLYGVNRVEARLAGDRELVETVAGLSAAALALGKLRGRGLLPAAQELLDPRDLARRIVVGGKRAALRVTPEQILLLADALVAIDEEEESAQTVEAAQQEMQARDIALAPIFVETPLPAAPLDSLIHDFLGVEATLRRAPSPRLRQERARLIDEMRRRQGESGAVDALVACFDDMRRDEHTAAERETTQRYIRAVRLLAAGLKLMETANV